MLQDAITAASETGAAIEAAGNAGAVAADAIASATYVAPTGFALVLAKISWFIVVPGFYIALVFAVVCVVARLISIFRAPAPAWQLAIYPAPKSAFGAAMRDAFGMPQILKRDPVFWVFLVMFHVGVAGLVLNHFDMLPQIHLVNENSRHMLGAGVVGLLVTIPVFYFIGRRFKSPVREISTPGDYLLLLLLLFTFLLGDLMSWGNSWTVQGFVMTKQDFARYFDGLLRLSFEDPRVYLRGTHYHFLTLHLLLAELTLMALPFTKIMHAFLSIPVNVFRRRVWKRS